ncbi:MAG: hypothetical protein ACOH1V_02430 [Stenotrophomonas sp.]
MFQTSRPLPASVPLCAPGHRPQLVKTCGAPQGHRIGKHCPPMFHIECHRCGLATLPNPSFALAEQRWTDPTNPYRIPISQLRQAREQVCAALAEAA